MLIFDPKLNAFYPPYQTPTINADKNYNPMIYGFTQDRYVPGLSGYPNLKVVALYEDDTLHTGNMFFAEFSNREDFKDWTDYGSGEYFSSYIEPWPDHVGDPARDKQPLLVYCYFKKTEDGFESTVLPS